MSSAHEAEVQCRTCKERKYVPWDLRHAGANPTDPDHPKVRCGPCKTGQDRTFYTGKMRGDIVPKNPMHGWI